MAAAPAPTRCPPAIHAAWRGALGALPIAVVDVETTGLDPARDRVVELAVIAGPRRVDTLVRPDPLDRVAGCHGLTAADLQDAPPFAEVAGQVEAALAGRILVGHFVTFDLAFLRAEFARAGRPLPPLPYICTAELADALRLGHERRRLTYACARYGVALPAHHVARHDAFAALGLFRRYAAIADQRDLDLRALAASGCAGVQAASWSLPPLRPAALRPVAA